MSLHPAPRVAIPFPRACLFAALLIAAVGCSEGASLDEVRAQHERGEYEQSIEPLRELLQERPDDPEVNYLYAHALILTQRPSLSTWALRKAMEDPDWTVRAGIQLAHAALAGADYNEAVIAADKVLEKEPQNVEAMLARANALAYWRKDPEAALADAARVLELDPDSLDAMKPRILALLALARTDEAREAIAELGRRIEETDAPESTRSWYCVTKAIFTEESEDIEGARKLWLGCLKDYPAVSDVVFSAVNFYDGQGEPERAVDVLQAALTADPNAQSYRSALAERLRLAGQPAEAEALLLEATESEDLDTQAAAWLVLGRFRRNGMDPAGAAEAMGRAYDLVQKSGGAIASQLPFEYAETLLLSRQFDRALELADALPVPAHQHLIRARAEQERGNPKVALAHFNEAFRLWPDNPGARYYAARAAEQTGDFERALEEYRTSIRADAGATDSRTRAAALLLAEGKPRMASQMLRQPHERPLDLTGKLLSLRMSGRYSPADQVKEALELLEEGQSEDYPAEVAELARGVGEGSDGPKAGLALLRKVRHLDFSHPVNAAALRRLVQLSHDAGDPATPAELRAALAKHSDSGAFQAIAGLDRELAGDAEGARAAYARAIELEPDNAHALAGLGRLAIEGDPAQAIGYFDRAVAADPSDPDPELLAAKAVAATGKVDEAARRLDTLLSKHPLEAKAALLRASLDLDRGVATDETLERARRAARLGGGADALDLLARVHEKRGEAEEAGRVADRARSLREPKASKAKADRIRALPTGNASEFD
jgi:tetratricopeptide (TPR) repeat protein